MSRIPIATASCFLILLFGCSPAIVRSTYVATVSDDWIKKFSPRLSSHLEDTSQVILVINSNNASPTATAYALEKRPGVWEIMFPPTDTVIGRNGFAAPREKKEGDGKTPSGIFTLGTIFGYGESPSIKMPYFQVTDNDVWVDDVNSFDYNRMVKRNKTSAVSFEDMRRNDNLYEYGIVINFNTEPIVRGDGSAIFFHVWMGPTAPTSGCIAMPKDVLLDIIKWLDPSRNPVAVIGTIETIKSLVK